MAAQCWCDESTKYIAMESLLAEAVARRIAGWMDTAAQHLRNEMYYRGLVTRCGAVFGVAARTCDDGSVVPDVLCAKVPELVESCGAHFHLFARSMLEGQHVSDKLRASRLGLYDRLRGEGHAPDVAFEAANRIVTID